MSTEKLNKILNYYKEVSYVTGLQKKDSDGSFPQANYSMYWFYNYEHLADELNDLTRAYLGDEEAKQRLTVEDIEPVVSLPNFSELNESQKLAVKNALCNPISFVAGPPGTGKTKTILNMVVQILARDKNVAVVSQNKEAINNIRDKIYEGGDNGEWSCLRKYYAELGDSIKRKNRSEGFTDKKNRKYNTRGWEQNIKSKQYLKNHPFITTTIHSIKKCFSDGGNLNGPDFQFDYVIMDEASQTSPLVGLIAMSCAKHFVVVGDLMQISAICTVNDSVKKYKDDKDFTKNVPDCQCPAECKEYDLYDFEDPQYGMSILKSAQLIFKNESNSAFLQEHYRCHPGIIGFCNDEIYSKYEKPLLVETKNYNKDIETPIRVRYFEGGYSEKHKNEAGSFKSRHNLKQIEVFMTDEWPKLHERLKTAKEVGEELSCCVISPFKGQLEQLKWEIEKNNEELKEDIELQGIKDAEHQTEEVDIPMLTVHKSQGREFDIVYFMPVDDYCWEWPWSQSRELVNVSVSRAKKELVVITSTCLMERELQKEFAEKYAWMYLDKELNREDREEADKKNLFIRKLCSWVRERFPEKKPLVGEFGFFPATNKSVFDLAYFYRKTGIKNVYECEEYNLDSAYEACLFDGLVGTGIKFKQQVKLTDTTLVCEKMVEEDEEHDWSFDFVLYDEDDEDSDGNKRVLLIIEVDGEHHRKKEESENRDEMKDKWVRENGGAVLQGNCYSLEEIKDAIKGRTFALLRLPTDGTTAFEFEGIKSCGDNIELHFTIENLYSLLKSQSKESNNPVFFKISEDSEDPYILGRIIDKADLVSLTELLKKGSRSSIEKEKINEINKVSLNEYYIKKMSNNKGWEPTELGRKKGIRRTRWKDDDPSKINYYCVYLNTYDMRDLILKRIEETNVSIKV